MSRQPKERSAQPGLRRAWSRRRRPAARRGLPAQARRKSGPRPQPPARHRSRLRRHTDTVAPPPALTDELSGGVEVGTRGNNDPMPKTSQEYGDSVREARGVRTRPVRPGQHA